MRKLQFDREQSNTNHSKPLDNANKNRSNSVGSRKQYKVSVIDTQDCIDRFILRQSERKLGKEQRESETEVEEDFSERTESLGKVIEGQGQKGEKVQATLKSSPQQDDKTKNDDKSLINSKDFSQIMKRKIELNRETRELNQTYVIDRKLIQSQKELTICDTKVYFPYQPYKVQLQYMQNVLQALQNSTNAVLQSPTGTGKTLCLLASVLSFVERQFRGEKLKHNVIYMSRTHSQLKQVQKELAKTCYRPNMAIFASREQLCLKENLSLLRGKEKIEACGRGVKLARKFKKQMVKLDDQDPKIVQSVCQFYKEREEVIGIGRRKLANKLLDIDIMKQVGREEVFCPYFYPLMTRDFTNLFIMPYNYLLDEYMLKSYQELLENSIIIFDEAHNVPEAACQGRSLLLETHHLQSALLELNKILSKYLSPSLEGVRGRNEKEIKFMIQMIQDFKESFSQFITEMFAVREDREPFNRDSAGREEPDVKVVNKERTDKAIFELFCGKVPDQRRKQFDQRQEYFKSVMMNKLILPIDEFNSYGVILIEQLKETPDGVFSNFEKVLSFCVKIKQLITPKVTKPSDKNWQEDELSHYRFYVNRTSSLNGPSSFLVGLRCLVPFLTFKDILRLKPRSILLTSGTLKPLHMWQKQLRVKFPMQLANKHVISPQQIAARVIKSGPGKTRFTFTYDNLSKNKLEVYKDFIDFLVQAAQRIPNGILLVFPSFKIQADFKYELMRSPKRGRLSAAKEVVFEEKSMDINMADFKKKALSSRGAILCIICRGKVSEGIDFPDGMCRAVFIVGIPYPNIKDPFIVQKKGHLQNLSLRGQNKSQSISGEQWYLMGTVRAINQAIGRVIRHASDYGMVFLVDTRYCDYKMQKELPVWVTQSMGLVDILQQRFYDEIEDFYQRMAQKYLPREENEEQYEESHRGGGKLETNALNILMGNRKKMKTNRKKIQNSVFDF